MKNLCLNDLNFFVIVAKCGTISGAARELNSSPATLSRRMTQLEDAIGIKLFYRHQNGYELTIDGRKVLVRLQPMTKGFYDFKSWLGAQRTIPLVRLSGGTWTIRFLSQRFFKLSLPRDPFNVVLLAKEAHLNIEQREIDIGLRNAPPTSPNLASRRIVDVSYAAFVHRSLSANIRLPWIGITPEHAVTRSSIWVLKNYTKEISIYVSSPQTLYDLAISAVGVVVLPCFIGDSIPMLRRYGPVIDALTEGQYIVFHNESRFEPHIRAVGDRIIETVLLHADLYRGKRRRIN